MNFLYLMDPLHTVHPQKDTTLALMVAAFERGHKVFYLPEGGMSRHDGKTLFNAISLKPSFDPQALFTDQLKQVLQEEDVDVIFVRNDPPFDADYLMSTWLLDLLPGYIAIINDPTGIRTVNEKIWASQFTSLMPPTCVARNKHDILSFIQRHGDVVVKPTGGFGGQSIFHIRMGESNKNVILETLSKNWTSEIIVQRFVPEAKNGDKRILLLDGEPLGAILRVQAQDDHRHNLFAGGKPHKADITPKDREIIQTLKPHLKALGLHFVGIDILGDYLTEVNVTSPTCLREMNELYGLQLHHQVVEFAEKFVEKKRAASKIRA
jgi:glutathione synthase